MYKGKKTLFYNGEKLWDEWNNGEYLVYDREEQESWEVIIVLPGVEVIPKETFSGCEMLETVIMSDTVRRIEEQAFDNCRSLQFVKISRNLEYIGEYAFEDCVSLTSIFIPPSCRVIDEYAFHMCINLTIFNVPQHTQLLGEYVIAGTALFRAAPVEDNEWVKGINEDEEYELHRACSSFNPSMEIIYGIVKRKGLSSFKKKNEIGVTAFDYLEANPFVENEIDQTVILKRYVLEMMGETV